MWTYRRMLRISQTAKIRNETVLERLQKDKDIIKIIKRRKLEYSEHVMKHSEKYDPSTNNASQD